MEGEWAEFDWYVWLFCFIPEQDKKFKQLRLERDPEHIQEFYAVGHFYFVHYAVWYAVHYAVHFAVQCTICCTLCSTLCCKVYTMQSTLLYSVHYAADYQVHFAV